MDNKSILFVYAHPDDESFSAGGTIAKYAAQGVDIRLVCATRGEAGKTAGVCEVEELGACREQELREAAKVLGINQIYFLDYRDKEVSMADPFAITVKIARIIRDFRPQVLITFGPDGSSGHQDHIAVHNYTLAAVRLAGQSHVPELPVEPYRVPRVYYVNFTSRIRKALGRLQDWPEPDTLIDTSAFNDSKLTALKCHRTQSGSYHKFLAMGKDKMAYYLRQEAFLLNKEYSVCQTPGGSDLFGECTGREAKVK
ncbi:MAG: PIG-L family deacetylase [Peptococcaceae bacterium]|nr:PIG-L family deacetylase [Peptococcaceae bacterium]